ncbi:MAG: hypothetical protein K0R54_1550 [Clostridiaceae bacterium]|jgi:uncharacterized protein YrzB (UPF0473 family)|nr:hypothetical protein [Clostridiaceae bacterium]
MDNNIDSITLYDEDNNEIEFDVITKMDIEDKEYVIVVPKGQDTDEAIALRIDKDEEDNEILVTIDDDDEFEIVTEAYETLFSSDELN